jgi:transposase-like protein
MTTDTLTVQSINKRRVRTYSDREKAKALTALDLAKGNCNEASRMTGIHEATIRYWRDRNIHNDVVEFHAEEKQELAERFEELAHLYISQAVTTVEHSKGTQAIVGAATATDKMRLLRGEPTSITADQNSPKFQAVKDAVIAIIQELHAENARQNLPAASENDVIEVIENVAKAQQIEPKLLRGAVLDQGEEQ